MTAGRVLKGARASGGVAIGYAVMALDPQFVIFKHRLRPGQTDVEVQRFRSSVEVSRQQLRNVQEQARRLGAIEPLPLIDAHLLILEDRMFVDRIADRIAAESINAEWAIQLVAESLFESYNRIDDEYFRERRGDLEDIVRRLMKNLQPAAEPAPDTPDHDTILVGRSIPPSVLFELRKQRVVGLITATGSPLSHTAIVARSLNLPAIVGTEQALTIASGDLIILDADESRAIINPSPDTLRLYRTREQSRPAATAVPLVTEVLPSVTVDGTPISLGANVNFLEEAAAAHTLGCAFIGLYRTEFDFLREGLDRSEDALVDDYRHILQAAGCPVTFRTIDVGADQEPSGKGQPDLGARGLRFSLENPELFGRQLRALYRASAEGSLRILLPFVSVPDELEAALSLLAEARSNLESRSLPFDADVPIGVMIETPAAALTCDLMAERTDFLCLGTNDLIQYYMAIDRGDRARAYLYSPFQPAILRCLDQISRLVRKSGRTITVCGEMAADPTAIALLIGLGFRSFSVNLSSHAKIRDTVRSLSVPELVHTTAALLEEESAPAIAKLRQAVQQPAGDRL